MLRLFHAPQTTADRVRWLLDEVSVPFELAPLDLSKGEHKKPEYLRLNPNGLVPTLVDGATVVYESAAILLHVADKYGGDAVAPRPGTPERAAYYQWMVYAATSLDPPALQVLLHKVILPPEQRSAAVARDHAQRFDGAARVVEEALGERQFVVGDRFTAADVMVAGALHRALGLGLSPERPALADYVARLTARPAAPFGPLTRPA
jgi:glutathione S-transferase